MTDMNDIRERVAMLAASTDRLRERAQETAKLPLTPEHRRRLNAILKRVARIRKNTDEVKAQT